MRKLKIRNKLELDKRVIAKLSEEEKKSFEGGTTMICFPKPTMGDEGCDTNWCTYWYCPTDECQSTPPNWC